MRSRPGLKLLGLCALVVGVMAIGASAAQAEETGGKWTYLNGAELLEVPNEEALEGEIELGTHATLLSEILKKKVEFLCSSFSVNEGKLFKGGTALGSLTFHGCTTKIGGVTQGGCEPNAKGIHPGLIETNKIKGELLLHKLENGTKDKIFITHPDEGTIFATIEMSELCSIGEEVPVGGLFAILPTNPETHEVKHLITEFAPLTHLWTISDTVEHKATIDGSAFAFLGGANEGKSWAALWN